MVAPVGAAGWGSKHVGMDKPIATGKFTRHAMFGGGAGFGGAHWYPVSGRAGLRGMGHNIIGLRGGPGIAATGFIDLAILKAEEDVSKELQFANAKLAELAEDLANRGDYQTKHRVKTAKAKQIYGENLGLEVSDYGPTPSRGTALGGFNVTETRRMKMMGDTLGVNLSDRDIAKIGSLEPLRRNVPLRDVETGSFNMGKYGFDKGDYTFFRAVPVDPHGMTQDVDVAVWRKSTGTWKGFEEMGVSDFGTAGRSPSEVGSHWDFKEPGKYGGIGPHRTMKVTGGSLVYFYADESMSEGLRAAATQGQRLFAESFLRMRPLVKTYSDTNFRTMVSSGRNRQTDFYGRGNDFSAFTHIGVNIRIPGPNAPEVRMHSFVVNFYHPIATSWNYGLIPGEGFHSISRGQRSTQAWRLAPVREVTDIGI